MIQLAEIYNMTRQKTYFYVQCQTVVHHNVCSRTKSFDQLEIAFMLFVYCVHMASTTMPRVVVISKASSGCWRFTSATNRQRLSIQAKQSKQSKEVFYESAGCTSFMYPISPEIPAY